MLAIAMINQTPKVIVVTKSIAIIAKMNHVSMPTLVKKQAQPVCFDVSSFLDLFFTVLTRFMTARPVKTKLISRQITSTILP